MNLYRQRSGHFEDGAIMFCGILAALEGVYHVEKIRAQASRSPAWPNDSYSYGVVALRIND